MSEKTGNNPDYIQHYPDAAEDVQKAHYVALRGNINRSHAAQENREGDIARVMGGYYGNKDEWVPGKSSEKVESMIVGSAVKDIIGAWQRGDIESTQALGAIADVVRYKEMDDQSIANKFHGADSEEERDLIDKRSRLPIGVKALTSIRLSNRDKKWRPMPLNDVMLSAYDSSRITNSQAERDEAAASEEYDEKVRNIT